MTKPVFTFLAALIFFTSAASHATEDQEELDEALESSFKFAKKFAYEALRERENQSLGTERKQILEQAKQSIKALLEKEKQDLLELAPTIQVKSVQDAIEQARHEGELAKAALAEGRALDPFRTTIEQRSALMFRAIRHFQRAELIAFKATLIPPPRPPFKQVLKRAYTVKNAITVGIPFLPVFFFMPDWGLGIAGKVATIAAYFAFTMPIRSEIEHGVRIIKYVPHTQVMAAFMDAAGASKAKNSGKGWLQSAIRNAIAGEQFCDIWLGSIPQ